MNARTELNLAGCERLLLAQRVADAHRGIDDVSLLSFVSGSTVEGIADARSDVDMSVVFKVLPPEEVLRAACRRVPGEWFWQRGNVADGLVVCFLVDGIEVQIGYNHEAALVHDLDDVLVRHDPDTPNHKLAEGVLKAWPLVAPDRLAALQQRLADFPPALGQAMVRRGLAADVSWRGMAQLLHRDTALWCRDLQVDACYRLLLMLCGLNRRYFTRFQVKRIHRLAAQLAIAPEALAFRIEAMLMAQPPRAFAQLHQLEGEVLDLVALHMPQVDLAAVHLRRQAFVPT